MADWGVAEDAVRREALGAAAGAPIPFDDKLTNLAGSERARNRMLRNNPGTARLTILSTGPDPPAVRQVTWPICCSGFR